MAGSHDLSFVAVRGASGSRQIYRLVIFARYHVRFRSLGAYSPCRSWMESIYLPFPSRVLILFLPDASLSVSTKQTLNKFLSNDEVEFILFSYFLFSLSLSLSYLWTPPTRLRNTPSISTQVVYREYKLESRCWNNIWRIRFIVEHERTHG